MKKTWAKIRRFYRLYTSGLNRKEVEQLVHKDVVDAYSYLKKTTRLENDHPTKPTPRNALLVIKEIFISFIMRLTPARRLIYGLVILLFIVGLAYVDYFYLVAAFFGMNVLLALELVDKLTTRDELEIARDIQISLQPEKIPQSKMLSIAAFSVPAKMVGGDFFDIVQPNNDWVIGILGDVSGKGISAALYAVYIQSMFQSIAGQTPSPSELMKNLNNLLCKKLRDGHFITAIIALFDLKEKTVTIARAGHNWPLYYCSSTRHIDELHPKGSSIGIFEDDRFAEILEEQKIPLNRGDLLLLYSDGITEATDPNKTMFDITGLKSVIQDCADQPCEDIIKNINLRLHSFVKSDELQDDATLMAIKIE